VDIVPPFNVVITGGSKGVGRALAAEFLRAGDRVVICGRKGALAVMRCVAQAQLHD
jgi:NAD(P)-dependent dehydrogenase (short-subunit alcohol dehydrogenase family)